MAVRSVHNYKVTEDRVGVERLVERLRNELPAYRVRGEPDAGRRGQAEITVSFNLPVRPDEIALMHGIITRSA